jgi:hypothetical protein
MLNELFILIMTIYCICANRIVCSSYIRAASLPPFLLSRQPSPVKPSHSPAADEGGEDGGGGSGAGGSGNANNIALSSSFALFNQSFDMNLEGLLGNDAAMSFGFGPTGSLSFGLGIGSGSVDYGDYNGSFNNNGAPRWSPRQTFPRMSPVRMMASDIDDAGGVGGGGSGGGEGRATTRSPPTRSRVEVAVAGMATSSAPPLPGNNVQVLEVTSSSSSAFGDVFSTDRRRRGGWEDGGDGPGDPVAGDGPSRVERVAAIDGTAARLPSATGISAGTGDDGRPAENWATLADRGAGRDIGDDPKQSRGGRLRPRKVDRTGLFGVMERHSALFDKFSFLFPGARTILDDVGAAFLSREEARRSDREVAFRRINAALCAFGGEAITSGRPDERPPDSKRLRRMQIYREAMPERFYEDESRLSWEIEEDPPIELSDSDEDDEDESVSRLADDDDSKFTSSLQRNIGVMVYPAVNAFTATEPGIITPALSEMNNFVDLNNPPESYPTKTQDEMTFGALDEFPPMVSPDFIRQPTHASLRSPFLTDGKTPQRSVNYAGGAWISKLQSPRNVTPGKNPENQSTDLLFVDAQELQPEQFRTVCQRKHKLCDARFLYPALPLPYGQRKRISNAMFAMSKSVPGLTDECAAVLGEARRRDAWDFAVAQLMTQVVVVTHCSVEDSRLDGLSKYLLTLGWVQ